MTTPDTQDLIKRLEAAYKSSMPVGDLWNLCQEAADGLERQTADHERRLVIVRQSWERELAAERELHAAELERLRAQVAALVDVGTEKVRHVYAGLCPDRVNGPNARDPDCPACKALIAASPAAPAQQADPKRELLQRIVDGATPSEGGLTASLRAVAADALAAPAQPAEWPCPDTGRTCTAEDCGKECAPSSTVGDLTRFDAVQRALDLASLMGGSIGQNDRDSTEAYRAQLRDHLLACIPVSPPAAQAEPVAWRYRHILNTLNPTASEALTQWRPVEPRDHGQTLEQRIAELRAYRYEGRPCYEVQALYAAPTSKPAAQGVADIRELAERAGMRMNLWSMGAASLAYSDGCEGVTREHLEKFAALLRAAQGPAAEPQWMPIETAPKDGRKLILAYRNRNDKARTVMARWVTDDEAAETDADGVGLEGGWYECIDNWDEYSQVTIHEGEPSHWMPLPAAPGFDVPVQKTGGE